MVPFMASFAIFASCFAWAGGECDRNTINNHACTAPPHEKVKDTACAASKTYQGDNMPGEMEEASFNAYIRKLDGEIGSCQMGNFQLPEKPVAKDKKEGTRTVTEAYAKSMNAYGEKIAAAFGKCSALRSLCSCAISKLSEENKNRIGSQVNCNSRYNGDNEATLAGKAFAAADAATASMAAQSSSTSDDVQNALQTAMALLPMGMMALRSMQNTDVPPPQMGITPGALVQGAAQGACVPGAGDPTQVCGGQMVAAAAPQNAFAREANGGFTTASTKSGSNFNAGSMADGSGAYPIAPMGDPSKSMASAGGGIPNASSPMQGGQQGGPATLGNTASANAGGAASNKADILSRDASGSSGYSQTVAGMNTATGSGGGYSAGVKVDELKGFRLADYLPGGLATEARGLASASIAQVANIQSKDVNIWTRISSHIKSRCNQGLLRDCIP